MNAHSTGARRSGAALLALVLFTLPRLSLAQVPLTAAARGDTAQRSVPPADAYRRGLMPLATTGVLRFAAAHPTWDGRGVLIAILDSGIDPGIAGLLTTSTGLPKIVDLRDFSHEGHVALSQVERRGDTLLVGSQRLLGASRVVAVAGRGAIWGGALYELPLGPAPQADVDGNGVVGDTLPVVVVKGSDGWELFADTQEDGTLADDRPVHDYAVAHEYFGWHHGRSVPPIDMAVNFADSAGAPLLDLFFDTEGHGSHVTGIAAGHDIYGVTGFDGVAPGAQVLGIKIANDAAGGVTVTGSMIEALEYAVTYAHNRGMPLVVNLSFGVGNELEGTARIDRMIDSVLEKHPDVVMSVAASNDGPGLSTIGFPASATRVVAVGAVAPLVFAGAPPDDTSPPPLASFSSRGGELAAPDVVAPGVAYSTVPNFSTGNEQDEGTSMAAPEVTGLAARLESALKASGRSVPAAAVAQALRAGAHELPSGAVVDQGAGLPDLGTAWDWLARERTAPQLAVDVGAVHGRGAVYLTAGGASLTAQVTVRRVDGADPIRLHLERSDAWIDVPDSLDMRDGGATFMVRVAPPETAGVETGAIRVFAADTSLGPLALIPVTVRKPVDLAAGEAEYRAVLQPGQVGRTFVPADSGRGLQIEVATLQAADHILAALHEPGGMPFRDGPEVPAGFGDAAAMFDLPANDVVSGQYEVDMVAGPLAADSGKVIVRQAPVRLGAVMQGDSLLVTVQSLIDHPDSFRFRMGLIGAARRMRVSEADDAPLRLAIAVPDWAAHLQIDATMPRADWSKYTDFGFTFQDRTGRQLAQTPINYATSRADLDLPGKLPGDSVIVLLAPAFAVPAHDSAWALDLVVHFYLTQPNVLDNGGSPLRVVAPMTTLTEPFAAFRLPFAMPAEYAPVLVVAALEGEQHVWSNEVALPVDAARAAGGAGPR